MTDAKYTNAAQLLRLPNDPENIHVIQRFGELGVDIIRVIDRSAGFYQPLEINLALATLNHMLGISLVDKGIRAPYAHPNDETDSTFDRMKSLQDELSAESMVRVTELIADIMIEYAVRIADGASAFLNDRMKITELYRAVDAHRYGKHAQPRVVGGEEMAPKQP